MGKNFRESMSLLHTWAGVVIGSVLFAIFWMGTLSVFDREIDRWMMPATRLSAPPSFSLDEKVLPALRKVASESDSWYISMPTERVPLVQVYYTDKDGEYKPRHINPTTGEALPEPGTHAGTGFIFPFHFSLHLGVMNLGYTLVGIAAMALLALLVSGVVIHRRIIADFFHFRPNKTLPRSSLDLHNLSGVLLLPFHFLFPLSGLFIFYSLYFPASIKVPFGGDEKKMSQELYGEYSRDKAKKPGTMVSLDALIKDAESRWNRHYGVAEKADSIAVTHPGDAAAYVAVGRYFPNNSVMMGYAATTYNAADGKLLKEKFPKKVSSVFGFIGGLHFVQFRHWTLRWLYFLGGLSGCVMIATGFVYWLETRRAQHAKNNLLGIRLVEGLTVGSVTGIIIATLAFFIANRVLPPDIERRADVETWAFYWVWLATFAHAWLRPTRQKRRAWIEQTWLIAALAPFAVILNWITTGDHLLRSLQGGLWGVVGMDLMLIAACLIAFCAARRLQKGAVVSTARAESTPSSVREAQYA